MQTRKRAKSVSFGKKHKEKEEKTQVKKAAEAEEAESVAEEKDKTEVIENKKAEETTAELSATPPKAEETPKEVETPPSEFVSDSPLSTTPELPKDTKEQEPIATETPQAEQSSELSQPAETTAQPTQPEQQGQQTSSEELSSTLPPSAFTIQTNEQVEQEASSSTEEQPKKKHVAIYFFVVAFIAFILGLGAMAGASYLGLVNVNFSKLPAGVNVPGFLGQKPTSTMAPPVATPTQKPVDLTTYTIAVLNGSGISGKAAEEKTALTKAGFKVASTGNADKSTYTKTEIAAKKIVNHDFLTKLQTELNKSYDVDTTIAASSDSVATDITITIGQPTTK